MVYHRLSQIGQDLLSETCKRSKIGNKLILRITAFDLYGIRAQELVLFTYSKTCLTQLLKKHKFVFKIDYKSLNAGQKYCKMLQESILQYFPSSLFKLQYVLKIFVLSIFKWLHMKDFTVAVIQRKTN